MKSLGMSVWRWVPMDCINRSTKHHFEKARIGGVGRLIITFGNMTIIWSEWVACVLCYLSTPSTSKVRLFRDVVCWFLFPLSISRCSNIWFTRSILLFGVSNVWLTITKAHRSSMNPLVSSNWTSVSTFSYIFNTQRNHVSPVFHRLNSHQYSDLS